jgi:hypothetical protein
VITQLESFINWPRIADSKRRQLFIRTHNETLSIIAVRVSNPDCSPSGIHG